MAASSVDKEKLLKKYFHRGYPYAASIMCTSDCEKKAGAPERLWERGCGSHYNVQYEKQQELNQGSEP